jgi:NADPH-dependent 2,4-dienoyl-CoA reductase/sulfur reductase-like enzyme
MSHKVDWPRSLWAAVTPAGPELPAIEGDTVADVVVVGAGFTGLSTALHLARSGIDVAVVEAAEPGWGASGRNNGQVIPTLAKPASGWSVSFETALRSCSIPRARKASTPRPSRTAGCSLCTRPAA